MILQLAAWLNDLDPFAVRFSGDFGIRWYGLAYIAGFAVAYFMLVALSRRGLLLIPRERIADAMMWLVGGTLIGGRLAYVLIYDRTLFSQFSPSAPFWGVFAINRGGMASHGGIVGVVLAAWRISRGWKAADGQKVRIVGRAPLLHVLDATALVCPAGLLFGRLANFINGELLGYVHSPAGTPGPWWTVQFPTELIHEPIKLAPEQHVALVQEVERTMPGLAFEQGLARMVEQSARYGEQLRPFLTSRYPSQLFQAAAEGLVLGGFLWLIWARPRKPGVVGCWFLIAYGVLRIVTEFWRLPDKQFGSRAETFGLSMGQWLSVGMIAAGVVLLPLVLRRPAPRLGGWIASRIRPVGMTQPPPRSTIADRSSAAAGDKN